MFRKLDMRTLGLAASLVIIGGAISSTPVSAQAALGAACWDQVMSDCGLQWSNWGLSSYSDCGPMEACQICPDTDGHECPTISWLDPVEGSRHDSHGHW